MHVQSPCCPTVDIDPVDVKPKPGAQLGLRYRKVGCAAGLFVEGRPHRSASHAGGEAEDIDEGAPDAEGDNCTVGAAIDEADGTLCFAVRKTETLSGFMDKSAKCSPIDRSDVDLTEDQPQRMPISGGDRLGQVVHDVGKPTRHLLRK